MAKGKKKSGSSKKKKSSSKKKTCSTSGRSLQSCSHRKKMKGSGKGGSHKKKHYGHKMKGKGAAKVFKSIKRNIQIGARKLPGVALSAAKWAAPIAGRAAIGLVAGEIKRRMRGGALVPAGGRLPKRLSYPV